MKRTITSFHIVWVLIFLSLFSGTIRSQNNLLIYPDSAHSPLQGIFSPGVFYVPKTNQAHADFMGNGIHQNSIRTNIIESVLNNTSNLPACLTLLQTLQTDLQALSAKCDRLVFIFEKMPAWLSSSSDPSPATTPGWAVLNTRPPANWTQWQTVVDSISRMIEQDFSISNAYFEIWNEPDLGSWTGSAQSYFMLYKTTFDGIRSGAPGAKIGGPAVNFWANNLQWQPPYGWLSPSQADSSLIGQLLDSAVVFNRIPDFLSFHNFNITHQSFGQAVNYIRQKTASLGIPPIPIFISEWNAPSQVRDTPLAWSFMAKGMLEIGKTGVEGQMVAAWQDFSSSAVEFHQDYGLLTYGGIHKPAYHSLLFLNRLAGDRIPIHGSAPFDGFATQNGDTIQILITNYAPPAFVEALNHTLFEGKFNLLQLDSAGYISIVGNSLSPLDSIFQGLLPLPNTNPMQAAILEGRSVFAHFDSLTTQDNVFNIQIPGYTGSYVGEIWLLDSTHNNLQYRYDSLRSIGQSQTTAISTILTNQNLSAQPIIFTNGTFSLSLQPNAVALVQCSIPGLTAAIAPFYSPPVILYPNPANEVITIETTDPEWKNSLFEVYNAAGIKLMQEKLSYGTANIQLSQWPSGKYWIVFPENGSVGGTFIHQR